MELLKKTMGGRLLGHGRSIGIIRYFEFKEKQPMINNALNVAMFCLE